MAGGQQGVSCPYLMGHIIGESVSVVVGLGMPPWTLVLECLALESDALSKCGLVREHVSL